MCVRHCGRAKVSLVSCVPANERAKAVSFGREKVRPVALCHRESAKKFALRAQNTPNSAFLGVLGEFFRGRPLEGPCWASFFAEGRWRGRAGRTFSRKAAGGAVLGEFYLACWRSGQVSDPSGALYTASGGGITRSRRTACRRRVGPSCGLISPLLFIATDAKAFVLLDVLLVRSSSAATLTPCGHNKTARRAAGRGWSGRRESNPPLKLGKLPFYR